MIRLSGSVKFFCAFGSGSSDGGSAGFPGFLRPSALRRSSPRPRLGLGCAAAFASASNSAFAARTFSARFFLSATQSAAPRRSCRRRRPCPPRRPQPPRRSAIARPRPQAPPPAAHALIAHRLVLGGVRLDLRPVERHMAELRQPRPLAQLENLPNRPASAFKWRLRKSETVRKSGGSSPTRLMKSTRSRAALAIRRDE